MTTISTQSALSGLKAAQRALDAISTNIANASTEGYTRKILPQETIIVNGIGAGVNTNALIRNVDQTLLKDLFKQTSVGQSTAIEKTYLDKIQAFHGASDKENSISAKIGNLGDIFSQLSTSPDSSTMLTNTMNRAREVADKFNEFSNFINKMRNDTETEMTQYVLQANYDIKRIADINIDITRQSAAGLSTADLEDQRDLAIKDLSKYIQISLMPGDNKKITVMTKQGQVLADEAAHPLVFNKSQLLPSSYYPAGGAQGVFIDSTSTGIALQGANIGGAIGKLLELRDETLPTYNAQLDELAQKIAQRFDSQGLRLFTDASGNVPANVAAPGAVGYVGFAATIQVNEDVVNDPSLIRKGTYGATVPAGSNEIIRKISEYAFGAYAYQQATGTTNISAGTLFANGVTQTNRVTGNFNITSYTPDLDAAPNITAPAQFTVTIGGVPQTITIGPGDTATNLVNNINTAFGANVASLNGLGQLTFNTTSNVTIADVSLGAPGVADLGLAFTTYTASNPSFTVQVGSQNPVTVSIGAGDTSATLLATLNAIPGLSASLNGAGQLVLTPLKGGDLTLRNVTGTAISQLGLTVSKVAHTSFRQSNLGPNADISTGLLGNSTIEDFSRSMVSAHAEDASRATDVAEKESAFTDTLQKRQSDKSGVNIDEELSDLIRVQTAYTAAAKVVSASERILDELFSGFFR